MEKSLYELIKENISLYGVMNKDFCLPPEKEEDGLSFADGAADGILYYHMAPASDDMEEAGKELMAKAVRACSEDNYEDADVLLSAFGKEHPAVRTIDLFQKYIIEHRDELDAGNLVHAAQCVICHSRSREAIKYGITILELFHNVQEKIKDILRTVGLSDEFTLFVIWAMRGWENGNDEIFHLAQNVHGWGKVHAVEAISPETQEIRDWLLLNGLYNGVLYDYTALPVWEKAEVGNRLKHKLTDEEFKATADIIGALLSEGPVSGISAVEDAAGHLLQFLKQTRRHELTIENYELMRDLRSWAGAEEANYPMLAEYASKMLRSHRCKKTVAAAVKQGNGLELARELGIPYLADLFHCMDADFEQHYQKCHELMASDDYAEATVKLFEEHLDFDALKIEQKEKATGVFMGNPQNNLFVNDFSPAASQLGFILQELNDKPLMGIKLVSAGLHSAGIRNRNLSLGVLTRWVGIRKMPLKELLPEMYREVISLKERETDDKIKEAIEQLLSAEV